MGVRLEMIKLGDEVLIHTKRWLCDNQRGIVVEYSEDPSGNKRNVLVQLLADPYQYWLKEDELEVLNK